MMKPVNTAVMKKYLMIYKKNPKSKVFALLADIYRKKGEIKKAFTLCQRGVKENPQFALGHIAQALVLLDMDKLEMATEALEKAVDLAPENLFAYKTLGQVWLKLKNPENTLKAYKMLLFLDPENKTALNIIKKLEPITSTQYDETGFAFKNLKEVAKYISTSPAPSTKDKEPPVLHPVPVAYSKKEKQQFSARKAMVEALIYRKDFSRARQFIREMKNIYKTQKWKGLIKTLEEKLPSAEDSSTKLPIFSPTHLSHTATSLLNSPAVNMFKNTITENPAKKLRKKQKKIQKLQRLLVRIEQMQADHQT